MKRRAFLIASSQASITLALNALAGCSHTPQTTRKDKDGTSSKALISELQKQIITLMSETGVPGVSSAVFDQDANLLWRGGFGVTSTATEEPVDHWTVFQAGSMSKSVFAYVVMKLCEKGVLDLDTPLTRYTSKRLLADDPRLELITARHVLSHTSGLQNWRSEQAPLKIHFQPGEKFLYSGEGYSYLQSIVSQLKGRIDGKQRGTYEGGVEVWATDIDAFMRVNLLIPFGMHSSGYIWNKTIETHAAQGHDEHGKPFESGKPTATDAARYAAAGGLLTTPTDFARFLIEVIAPKRADDFRLTRSSIDEMIRPHVKTNDEFSSSWALGWQVFHTDNGDVIGHGGNNRGFHAIAAASLKRKTGIVVMTNGDNGPKLIKNLMSGEIVQKILVG